MAQTHWELTGFKAAETAEGFYSFVAVMNGPGGVLDVPIGVESILHYERFQREMLLRAAMPYRNIVCEGRTANEADGFWQNMTMPLVGTAKIIALDIAKN
jgi:hypothetical protein